MPHVLTMQLYILIVLGLFNVPEVYLYKINDFDEQEPKDVLKFEWDIIAEFMRDQYIVTLFVEHNYAQQSDQILKYSIGNYRFGIFHYNNVTLITEFWRKFHKNTFAGTKRYGVTIIVHDVDILNHLVESCANNKVVLVFFNKEVPYIKRIMTNLWNRYKIFKIIGVLITSGSNRIIQFNPFESSFYEYPVHIERSSEQFGQFLNKQFRRFLSDMAGYEIRLYIFDVPLVSTLIRNSTGDVVGSSGLDGEMLKFCQQFMNFTPHFVSDQSTKQGGIEALVSTNVIDDGIAEVGLNGRFLLDVSYNKTVFLNPIDKVALRFVVPINYEQVPLKLFAYYYFDSVSQIVIGVSLVLLTVIWFLGIKIFKQNAESDSVSIPLNILALLHGTTVKVPKKRFNKILFITTATFGLFLTNIYQGTVVQQLNNPLKPQQINTLNELLTSDLNISVLSYLKDSDDLHHNNQADNLIMMGELGHRNVIEFYTVTEGMNAVACNKNVALLMPVLFHGSYLVRYFNKTTGLDLVHSISETPVSLLVSYVIARDSPYIRVFNYVSRIFVESGAMRNQLQRAEHQQSLVYIRRFRDGYIPKGNTEFRSINLKDALLIRYLFLIGILSSLIVFCLEHLVYLICKYKDK